MLNFVERIGAIKLWIRSLFLKVGKQSVMTAEEQSKANQALPTLCIDKDKTSTVSTVSAEDGTEIGFGLLGKDANGLIGFIDHGRNEISAWRDAKRINAYGGKVKVVQTINGKLSDKHEQEKSAMFEEAYAGIDIRE